MAEDVRKAQFERKEKTDYILSMPDYPGPDSWPMIDGNWNTESRHPLGFDTSDTGKPIPVELRAYW